MDTGIVYTTSLTDLFKYDMNSTEITQEYDPHVGPVNTITLIY
jgi:hypothetical protein